MLSSVNALLISMLRIAYRLFADSLNKFVVLDSVVYTLSALIWVYSIKIKCVIGGRV